MIKVFEAFAGYGSQRMALKNLLIPHEVVGISEIDGDAILSYSAIHDNLLIKTNEVCDQSEIEMKRYLESINVPLDYKNFKNKAQSLRGQKLKNLYLANIISKNYGDIRIINPESLPDFDLLTYSFPCQDISQAGFQKGFSKNSGTRSSLLWECCKIIEFKKPRFLLMENVKNLVGKNHKVDFDSFLSYLESIGYKNFWKTLNAREYGIPQNRERVFCLSVLDYNGSFDFPKPIKLVKKIEDYLENSVAENFYLSNDQVLNSPINQEYIYCLDSNYWKGTFLVDFLQKKRRQLITAEKNDEGKYRVRRLTPIETWRLMGCKDNDFYNAKHFVSNTSLYKQAGNSVVVQVLEFLFNEIFSQIKGDLK